jgi:hypothetical protein
MNRGFANHKLQWFESQLFDLGNKHHMIKNNVKPDAATHTLDAEI